ncbi:flavodoxin, short chain [Anaerocolumna jejuensis DSM 15929]|jgi:flavodoxin short chain|uniref:Flavodoxin n=1 Tax=Anaerocolumna jejuensis DSM 15929 TaxID=1121322 RepID=A0A1M6ZZE7_9FIRM|nr:flavodoxin [Anaerocolumna jejuensis]SHL35814.1 flavodoxin, short chain [Anaerocolumna jejuensis DSM 15929]
MSKINVVYWSGTGNTKAMAEKLGEGIKEGGKDPEVTEVSKVKAESLKDEPVFALGCPSMGAEVLEEEDMEPFVAELEQYVQGKQIALFGSYGWGDCEWMRDWEERLKNAGAQIVNGEGITCLNEPEEDTLSALFDLGKKLAEL